MLYTYSVTAKLVKQEATGQCNLLIAYYIWLEK